MSAMTCAPGIEADIDGRLLHVRIQRPREDVRYNIRMMSASGLFAIRFPMLDDTGRAILPLDFIPTHVGWGCSKVSVPKDVIHGHVEDWCNRGWIMEPDEPPLDTDFSSYASDTAGSEQSSVWNTSEDSSSQWETEDDE